MSDKRKKLIRELMELRGIGHQAALQELEELGPDVAWRGYIDKVREQVLTARLPEDMRRQTADGIVEAVQERGKIKMSTLEELLGLLASKTNYDVHIEVAVVTNALLKTIDNEEDAQETIRRLRLAPPKEKSA